MLLLFFLYFEVISSVDGSVAVVIVIVGAGAGEVVVVAKTASSAGVLGVADAVDAFVATMEVSAILATFVLSVALPSSLLLPSFFDVFQRNFNIQHRGDIFTSSGPSSSGHLKWLALNSKPLLFRLEKSDSAACAGSGSRRGDVRLCCCRQ